MTTRLWIAATCVLLIHGAARWIEGRYAPDRIRPSHAPLTELPLTLGEWDGMDSELDQRLIEALGTDTAVNRRYVRTGRGVVDLHCALWTTGDEWLPHEPHVCYTGSGWNIDSRRQIDVPEAPGLRATLLVAAQKGQRIQVLYWYQLGDRAYSDRDGARGARRQLWGEKTWPPLIKVMLQAPADDPARLDKGLADFAHRVFDWTKAL
jgi:EpsI family protein